MPWYSDAWRDSYDAWKTREPDYWDDEPEERDGWGLLDPEDDAGSALLDSMMLQDEWDNIRWGGSHERRALIWHSYDREWSNMDVGNPEGLLF
jgi:hypothetical protein